MFKQIIICVTLFNTLNAILKEEPPECLQNSVKLDVDFLTCCRGKPTFTSDYCVDELMNSNYTSPTECMVDCMYKDFKFYNDSKIDMNGVKTFFEGNVNQQDVREMFINGFEACSKLERSKIQRISYNELTHDIVDCDLFPFYMDQCVWYHTLSNCPERLTGGEKEQCQTKTNWVKQCLFN